MEGLAERNRCESISLSDGADHGEVARFTRKLTRTSEWSAAPKLSTVTSRERAIASLITHPIVPITAAICLGRRLIPPPLLVVGILLAMLPDADSITFQLGIPYSSPIGHRGATHSISFALVCAALVTLFAEKLRSRPIPAFLFCSASMLSHGALDAMTTAGLGVGFFWPFDTQRFFFDLRPIEASPISVRRFFTVRAWPVLRTELLWVWLPALCLMMTGLGVRRLISERTPRSP